MAERSLTVLPKELMGVRAAGNYDFDQLYRFAQVCHASGLFEDTADAAQAFAKIAKGQEIGLPPMAAMSAIDIIRKRLYLKPWAIAAKINTCGYGSYRVTEQTPERCAIVFRKKYAGEGWVALPEVRYTYTEAKAHGLVDRSPHWKASPAHMLYQRCMGRGGAMYFPELLAGLDVPQDEELVSVERRDANVVALFGDGQGADATAFPASEAVRRTPLSDVPPHDPSTVFDSMAQIEAAIAAQHGEPEPWYVWAERTYRKARGAFTVPDWADFLATVRQSAAKLATKTVPPETGEAGQTSTVRPEGVVPTEEPDAPAAVAAGPQGGARRGRAGKATPLETTTLVTEAAFLDPETGELLTPSDSEGPSWGPESPNLFAEEEAEAQRQDTAKEESKPVD